MSAITEKLEQYTFQYLMQLALSRVPVEFDKREGSIIYDALAPACMGMADIVSEMRDIALQTYMITSSGENTDNRAADRGITRKQATKSVKKAVFTKADGTPMSLSIGTRFSTIGDITYTYSVISETTTGVVGTYNMQCEQFGTIGNDYIGNLIPISYLPPLGSAIMGEIIIPGSDIESDEDLISRYLSAVNSTPFAGNIAAYDNMCKDIEGVGDVQVYPTWDGGGTVKLSIVDIAYNPATPEFVDILEAKIDPENSDGIKGTGLGMAGIDHKVTVVAPTPLTINITANVVLRSGYTIAMVTESAEKEISEYLLSVRKAWGEPDKWNNYNAAVYTSQITSAILRTVGIENVTDTKTNGTAEDKILTQTSALQQLPMLGTVILSEL